MSNDAPRTLAPPAVERRRFVHRAHGIEREDPFHWLADGDDPAVDAHLEAENRYVEARLAHLGEQIEALRDELRELGEGRYASAPVEDGPWAYVRRADPGAPPVYVRRPRSGDGPEQVLLDLGALAREHHFVRVLAIEPSPDHRHLAVVLDTEGDELAELRVLDVQRGEWREERRRPAVSAVWADGSTLLWAATDETNRSCRVHRLVLGADGPDEVVLEEPDPTLWIVLERAELGWVRAGSGSRHTQQWHLLDGRAPGAALRCLAPRRPGVRYVPHPGRDRLWLLVHHTDRDDGGRVMCAPLHAWSPDAWEEVVPERPGVRIEALHVLARHLVRLEREAGQVRVRVRRLRDGDEHTVAFPDEAYQVALGDARQFHADFEGNREPDASWIDVFYTSLTTPKTTFRYHLDERRLELLHQVKVPGHDPADHHTRRLELAAPDGTMVPATLVHRADVRPGPDTPLWVFGYGAYGSSVDPEFRLPPRPFLSRGGVFAVAHVRGGGYLGRAWYDAGRLDRKQNTFSDFVAVVRGLHAEGIGSPRVTVVSGGSGGGLLVGAVMNQAPDVCAAAIADHAFVDALTAMLDPTLPLTTAELEEWGDPRQREGYDSIAAWSPYDNVAAQPYPDLFATAARQDPRAPYWGPAKWVARLRATATRGDFVLRTAMRGGHFGSSVRDEQLRTSALRLAWALERLGMLDGA